MVRLRLALVLMMALLAPAAFAQPVVNALVPGRDYIVLNYHDIQAQGRTEPPFDRMAVARRNFGDHLQWLMDNDYHFISAQNLIDAAAGKAKLPANAVLLTFDDGFESFYTRVFPMLKKYKIPAVEAIIGTWIDGSEKPDVPGDKPLLNWAQIKEVQASGLVEIASHTFGLHNNVLANPQGTRAAAATTRVYDPAKGRYETDAEYGARITSEMQKGSDFLFAHLGTRPRIMVWPFGEYNAITVAAAKKAGMPITFALGDGANSLPDLSVIDRLIITDDPETPAFANIVTSLRGSRPQRVVHIDLDYVWDKDPAQLQRNLNTMIDRVAASGANTIYLQAFADPDGDGNADALYFPNRHLPMRADLFGYAVSSLKARTGAKIYAWMPMMAFKGKDIPANWYVQEWRDGKAQPASHIYTRLSPFVPAARAWVGDLYEDLAKYTAFDGVLFHDDGILSDYEDAAPAALAYGHKVWGLPADFATLHATPAMRLAWAQKKTALMTGFTDDLAARVRVYRPYTRTARNMYSRPILQPDAEEWYAQSLPAFLAHYDFVAVEAMPAMEQAEDRDAWLMHLVEKIDAVPGAMAKTVFEVQSLDWNTKAPVDAFEFGKQLALLKGSGAVNIGYYPDSIYRDQPPLAVLQKYFALPVVQP